MLTEEAHFRHAPSDGGRPLGPPARGGAHIPRERAKGRPRLASAPRSSLLRAEFPHGRGAHVLAAG
eukprot:3961253-Pyramimonas_sp.AAC.1